MRTRNLQVVNEHFESVFNAVIWLLAIRDNRNAIYQYATNTSKSVAIPQ